MLLKDEVCVSVRSNGHWRTYTANLKWVFNCHTAGGSGLNC